jgi:hypothetical protein
MMIAQRPEMTPAEEIQKIENALCELLAQMLNGFQTAARANRSSSAMPGSSRLAGGGRRR